MSPRFLLLEFIAAISLCQACQRFENQFDSVGSLCGVDPASIGPNEVFVKLESPRNEPLSPETLLLTRSRFLLGSTRSQALPISSRGCVRLPAASGILQAFSSDQGWSLSQNLSHPAGRTLLRLPMQPSPKVSAELQCPDQGYYAHEDLPFPLRWTSDGPLQSTRFEILAEDESQQKSFVLFEKPYGIHLTDLPQNIITSALPEGTYRLRLSFQISTAAWDLPGSVPARMESCPLTVLHRRPEVGGLDGYTLDNRVAVFAKGEILPWRTPSAQSDLLYCREKRAQDIDEGDIADQVGICHPQAQCQDLKNFQKSGAIVADEPGVFDYYAYALDKAGNRSSISCQTLVISDNKPQIHLLWSDAAWNKPAAQMRTPRAEVQLRILGSHPQLEDASLASRYQCKAEFVRDDQSTLSGRPIICSNGRCKNKSLENYVPCDADLSLSLVGLWPNIKAEGGVLRVFVKADDRAGHIEEQIASVGIQPRLWKPTRLSPSTELLDSSTQLIQDRQGRIFNVKFGDVSLRNMTEDLWQKLLNPVDGSINGVKLWLSAEQEVYSQWSTYHTESAQAHFDIFRWADSGWQKIEALGGQNLQECIRPQSFHRGGFWCETQTGIAIYQDGQWTTRLFPAPESGGVCNTATRTQFLVQDQQKTLWLACNQTLFKQAEGQSTWTPIAHPIPLVAMGIDSRERLWLVRGTGRDDLEIQLDDRGQTKILPAPSSFTWLDIRPQEFVIGPSSEIILGDSYWDDSKEAWQVFPYLANRRAGLRVMPHFSIRGELFWETEQGLLQWDGQGLRLWDFTLYGLKQAATGLQAFIDNDGAPWVLASPGGSYVFPFQFHLRNWMHFPKPGRSPNSSISGLWVDDRSMPQVYIPSDGLYSLQSTGWEQSMKSPGLEEETPLETSSFEPILLSPNGVYSWTPEQDWRRLIHFPEPTYYYGGTKDSQGRFWIYQDSMELGVIDGQQFHKVPLGANAGSSVYGIFRRDHGVLAATDAGLLSREEGQPDWTKISWQDWGLDSIDRIRQIDADTYLVSVTGGGAEILQLWMLDFKTRTKKAFVVPNPTSSLGNIKKTSKGDYIIVLQFNIFRTDGETMTPVFTRKDLYSLPEVTGTFLQIRDMQVDAQDRIWFHVGNGVVRIDL